MIGIILFTPIFNEPATQILKAATGKFILEGIAVLAIYLGLRARKGDAWVGAGSPRDMLLGVAAFIIAFILFEFVIKGLTHTQIVLASFAAAYALLSYIAWKQAREGQGGTANF